MSFGHHITFDKHYNDVWLPFCTRHLHQPLRKSFLWTIAKCSLCQGLFLSQSSLPDHDSSHSHKHTRCAVTVNSKCGWEEVGRGGGEEVGRRGEAVVGEETRRQRVWCTGVCGCGAWRRRGGVVGWVTASDLPSAVWGASVLPPPSLERPRSGLSHFFADVHLGTPEPISLQGFLESWASLKSCTSNITTMWTDSLTPRQNAWGWRYAFEQRRVHHEWVIRNDHTHGRAPCRCGRAAQRAILIRWGARPPGTPIFQKDQCSERSCNKVCVVSDRAVWYFTATLPCSSTDATQLQCP